MANVTYRLPRELHEKIKDHPEIRWGEIVRQAFTKKIDEMSHQSRISLKDLEKKIKIEYKPFSEEKEIELTLKSMELSRLRTQELEEAIQGRDLKE
ncbi:MAG: hypothetical protein ACTSWW_07005 [Promethearchaeota archaeon]